MNMKLCECGCGKEVRVESNRFLHGHNPTHYPHTLDSIKKGVETRMMNGSYKKTLEQKKALGDILRASEKFHIAMRAPERREKIRKANQGTYKERYGDEKAVELKENKRSFMKNYVKTHDMSYMHTPESRRKTGEKNSINTTRNYLSGNIGNKKGRIGFYSIKNQKQMFYRSSYELIAMKIFEQMNVISKYEYETLSIPWMDDNNVLHRTIPDFVVYYTNNTKQIIEVKPQFKIDGNLDNTLKKLEADRKFSEENNMTFSVWTEKELGIDEYGRPIN